MTSELINAEQKSLKEKPQIAIEDRLEIIDEYVRRKYLTRLSDMQIMPLGEITPLEEDIIDNVRLYRITEMVYQKDESVMDKFTTVFNTLATYNVSVFLLIDSDGEQAKYYLGVRNNEANNSSKKRSTVTLGDTLKQTLKGHFPGIKIENEDRKKITELSEKIMSLNNVSSVSVVGSSRCQKDQSQNEFAQGMEKLCLAMSGRPYTAVIIADNKNAWDVQQMRKHYQELYTALSPLQKIQISDTTSQTESRSQSFAEMDGKQKAAMITNAVISIAGTATGVALGAKLGVGAMAGTAAMLGGQIGGQAGGQISNFISSLAPTKQITKATTTGITITEENKAVTDMLVMLDEALKKMNEYDSYGLWNVAGYFLSDDMSASEIAASNYRSLMNGDNYGREVSAINSWRSNDHEIVGEYRDLTTYLSRFVHPLFNYGGNIMVTPSTNISGKELGLHLGLPRSTVPGLPVIEHAEFGKEVNTYQLFEKETSNRPEDKVTLKDKFYRKGDEVGHGIPDQFGGPASKENTFAQAMEVNRGTGSKIRQVERLAAQVKKEGHTVDYEMRANYSGTRNSRPTSFEPHITVDGQEYELPEKLKKIYNISKETTVQKAVVNAKEQFGTTNEIGVKSGIIAAGLTCAMSSVDNISACVNGEISGEEVAVEIVKDTAVAGGVAYGTAFVSTAVAETMKDSSKVLIQRIGNSCLPAAAATFAVSSADSIINFAKGEIDGGELIYELGDSASSVAGGLAGGSAGAKFGAAVGTVIAPGVGSIAGTVVGGVVGGVVGTVVASEAYATAVENGTEGAKFLAEKAETMAKDTVELIKENLPEKLDSVKLAFNDFSKSCNLSFSV